MGLLVVVNYPPRTLSVSTRQHYYIEPYTPSRFARQFGYMQLYVGNPNKELTYQGNLYKGTRG